MNEAARWITDTLARRAPHTASMPVALRPRDLEAGYALQDEVSRLMTRSGHGQPIGWKVGSTTPSMQQLLQVPQPAAGRMFTSSLLTAGQTIDFGRYRRPAVECEIAIRLAHPLDARERVPTREDIVAAIDSLHPAIELVDDRYGDFAATGAALMVADHFFHSGLVLGEAVPGWRALDLAALRGSTWVNGEERCAGRGADVLGHPLNAVAWLATHLARRGQRLEAGDIITTGSLPLPHWAQAGQQVEIRIESLGRVALSFSG